MSNELRDALAAIDEEIRRLSNENDAVGEANAREQRALLLTGLGDEQAALAELSRAEQLLEQSGQPILVSRAAYGRGMLLERLPGREADAHAAYTRSAELARQAGSDLQLMKAWHRRVLLLTRQHRLAEGHALLQDMAGRLREIENDHGLVDVHRHMAAMSMALGRPNRALDELATALEHARRHGDPRKTLQVRLERRNLQPFAISPTAEWEDWQALIDDAAALDESGAAGQAHIQQAAERLRGDDAEAGERSADEARQLALQANDPVLYLMSCLLIAEARHLRDDRVGVLQILLTCKATLTKTFGPEAAQGLVMVLESLKDRWGEEGLREARLAYREWMRRPQA